MRALLVFCCLQLVACAPFQQGQQAGEASEGVEVKSPGHGGAADGSEAAESAVRSRGWRERLALDRLRKNPTAGSSKPNLAVREQTTPAQASVHTLTSRIDEDAFRQIADRALAGLVVEAKSCGPDDSGRLTTIRVPNVYKDIQALPRFEYELTEEEKEKTEYSAGASGVTIHKRRRSKVRGCVNRLSASQRGSVSQEGRLRLELEILPAVHRVNELSHEFDDLFVVGRTIHEKPRPFVAPGWEQAWDWKDYEADRHLPDYEISRAVVEVELEPAVLDGRLTYSTVTAAWSGHGDWNQTDYYGELLPGSHNFHDEKVHWHSTHAHNRTSVKERMTEYVESMQVTIAERIRAAFDSQAVRDHLSKALTQHAVGDSGLQVASVSKTTRRGLEAVVAKLAPRPAALAKRLSAPSCVSWGPGHIDCFVRGRDNRLKHATFDGSWSDWRDLGGDLRTGPEAVSWVQGRLDVFARGKNRELVHIWAQGAKRQGRWDLRWSSWESLGGSLHSKPGCASWSRGRIDCFARGHKGQLLQIWYQDRWSAWVEIAGHIVSAPSVTSWKHGRLDVFARGGNGQLLHTWYDGEWSNRWEELGGAFQSLPGCVSPSEGRIECFVRGRDDQLNQISYSGGWQPWKSLGGQYKSAPSATSSAPGRLDVFAGKSDRRLWHTWFDDDWHAAESRGGDLYALR